MASTDIKAAKGGKDEVATVARYRSVEVAGVVYKPGETITLPADEVADLRRKGFLVSLIDAEEDENSPPKVKITKPPVGASSMPKSVSQSKQDSDLTPEPGGQE